jgi:hypothetical protein
VLFFLALFRFVSFFVLVKVDVTYLLTDENEKSILLLTDETNQELASMSSSASSDEGIAHRSMSHVDDQIHDTMDNIIDNDQQSVDAASELENDVKHLTGMIQQDVQHICHDKIQDGSIFIGANKKSMPDDDDDTSKQATQTYDLEDDEKHVRIRQYCLVFLPSNTSNHFAATGKIFIVLIEKNSFLFSIGNSSDNEMKIILSDFVLIV